MKVITTTGFFNTGSSAITHMLKEFDTVSVPDNVYEMRLLYDPDCISDLEYNLIDNPHRQNTSLAIIRFIKYIDFNSNSLLNHHYNKIFKNKFKKISYEYVSDICRMKFFGYSHIDKYYKGKFFWFLDRCYIRILRDLFSTREMPSFLRPSLISNQTLQYAGIYDRDEFYMKTKQYIKKLFNVFDDQKREWLVIDQLVPATNICRYLNYIPDEYEMKVFVVDRDPRDLFVTFKYFTKVKGIPCNDVTQFCDWFEWTRGQASIFEYKDNIFRVQFEDMIYDYENTRKKILGFLNMEDTCCSRFKYFDPKKSINNTQVWYRFLDAKEEVEYIQTRLSDYLYDFERFDMKPDYKSNNMFDC